MTNIPPNILNNFKNDKNNLNLNFLPRRVGLGYQLPPVKLKESVSSPVKIHKRVKKSEKVVESSSSEEISRFKK